MYVWRDRKTYFKELAHTIVEASKFEIHRATDWKKAEVDITEAENLQKTSVLALKAFN